MKASTSTYRILSFILAGIIVCAGVMLGGCSSEDAGALYEKKCSTCHTLERVEQATYSTESQWLETIARMQQQTDSISDDDAAAIAAYLASK